MGSESALILEIKRNSLDDGPGIRTVVFFKGCPLDCLWCHNPESKKAAVELSWDGKECIRCLNCEGACPENAVNPGSNDFINRLTCNLCFACVDVCPSGAMSRVGKAMAVDDVIQVVLKDKPFFDTSGGGVTLSGGEPLLKMDFASKLLQKLKQNGISTLIETSGYFNWGKFENSIAPYTDIVYYDIKLIDEGDHEKYCGASNKQILANFKKLAELSQSKEMTLLPRVPLVPGITATRRNLERVAAFVKKCGIQKVELLRYNPLWPEKSKKLGLSGESIDQRLTQWMPPEEFAQCSRVFINNGLNL